MGVAVGMVIGFICGIAATIIVAQWLMGIDADNTHMGPRF